MEKSRPERFYTNDTSCRRGCRKSLSGRIAKGLIFSSLTLGALYRFLPEGAVPIQPNSFPWDRPPGCPVPKANLFAYSPPRPSNEIIIKATEALDNFLAKKVAQEDGIDNLAIAIVTPAGPIFQKGYGVLKANETCAEQQVPDGDSIYRIASISKMFTVLETLILRERGVINWDDPIDKYLPDFSPPLSSYGWSRHLANFDDPTLLGRERLTLRQVASHLSGLGRDYPPVDLKEWPTEGPLETETEAATNGEDDGFPQRSYSAIIKSISQYPLINLPWQYPIYSNVGFDVLGLANVAANKLASSNPGQEPKTHKELIKRDIFDPLGLTGSFFEPPASESLRQRIAVPKENSSWADVWLGDADDPAGGQYSSLSDLIKVMQVFLSPTGRGNVVPSHVMREWLRPLHTWGPTGQEVGAPWEIAKFGDTKAYSKGGNLPGYHTEFAIFPEHSYGIIVLVNGQYSNTLTFVEAAAKHFQAAVSRLYTVELERRFVGKWTNGDDVAEIFLDKKGKPDETLMIRKLVIGGIDVLKNVQDRDPSLAGNPKPMALWSTGRAGEFRLAFGRKQLNSVPGIGCWPYWVTIDPGLNSRGAPIDLLFWERGQLTYPSAGVSFSRDS